MPSPQENAVTEWFGPQFAQLHPLLQGLHRDGGSLHGIVHINTGHGLGALIGRRLARRLGIPLGCASCDFRVDIRHEAGALFWERQFGEGHHMRSVFRPVGRWPTGYWIEQTGPLGLRLTVDVIEGGWHWRCIGLRFGGLPLPSWLLPRSRAFKTVEQGRYRFVVEFALPVLGPILRYQGLLEAEPGPVLGSEHYLPQGG